MDFPLRLKKGFHVFRGQIVRRAVWTVQNRDLPATAEFRQRSDRRHQRFSGNHFPDMEHVTRREGTAAVTAETAEREGRTAAEIFRHVNAAAHGEVAALAAAGDTDLQHITRMHFARTVAFNRHVVQFQRKIAARHRDQRLAVEPQSRAGESHFQSRSIFGISDNAVGEPEMVVVHRTRRRNADVPVAETSGIILHRGLCARSKNLKGRHGIGEIPQQSG